MTTFVGTDIGGTFTDLVGFDSESGSLLFGKRLTTSSDLVEAVMDCLDDVDISVADVEVLKHGTTQVINTLLELQGARTALISTEGFRDVLEIGRAGRPVAFKLDYRPNKPLVPRSLRFEMQERIAADGTVIRSPEIQEMECLAARIEAESVDALAISFVNSYANPVHEQIAATFFRKRLPHCYVTTGTELSRQWFEFERASTVVANAYVGPRTTTYIRRFETVLSERDFTGQFHIMGSNGGLLSPDRARAQPIALVESGPIGGGVGAAAYATELGLERLIAFDMGGTTAKCTLIEDGDFSVQSTYYVGGYEYGLPIRSPILDIVEVGTGGGSIAHLARDGALKVGPRSAGSDPGPVCFSRGGTEPTVTDANIVLDRISDANFLNGKLMLDRGLAVSFLMEKVGRPLGFQDEEADTVASGIVTLSNSQMADAIKEITIERGRDVRDFCLFAFGGGGPLHGVELARQLHVPQLIVPPEPGNFSSVGMLLAGARLDESRTLRRAIEADTIAYLNGEVASVCERMSAELMRDLTVSEIVFETSVDICFTGQRHSLKVPFRSREDDAARVRTRFHHMYGERYGHVDEALAIELVGYTVTAIALTPRPDLSRLHRAGTVTEAGKTFRDAYVITAQTRVPTRIVSRYALPVGATLLGPAAIEEFGSTTIIGPNDRLEVGTFGELRISIAQD